MATFLLEMFVIFNMITDLFLVEKWGTLERAKRYVCFRIVFVLASFNFENEESFGKSSYFPFSAKCFDRNFKYLF